jgi:hypothetical protein
MFLIYLLIFSLYYQLTTKYKTDIPVIMENNDKTFWSLLSQALFLSSSYVLPNFIIMEKPTK